MTRAEIDRLRERLTWHHELAQIEVPVTQVRELLEDLDRLEARLRAADIALAEARLRDKSANAILAAARKNKP